MGLSSPSLDYWVFPRLRTLGYTIEPMVPNGIARGVARNRREPDILIICRYLSAEQHESIVRQKLLGARIVYFMDDDLFDPSAWVGLPLRYRWKLFRYAYVPRNKIIRLSDEVWVSTPYLAQKYKELKPVLLNPSPLQIIKNDPNESKLYICYHGTASHALELDWIWSVMKEVLAKNNAIHFQLFGDKNISRRFSHLPRTIVMHHLPWPSYVAFTESTRTDIGLAPLLPNDFNKGRGPTKWFDYARMGAVGIFSNSAAYGNFVNNNVDGYLLPNEPEKWIEKILNLANDHESLDQAKSAVSKRLKGYLGNES